MPASNRAFITEVGPVGNFYVIEIKPTLIDHTGPIVLWAKLTSKLTKTGKVGSLIEQNQQSFNLFVRAACA